MSSDNLKLFLKKHMPCKTGLLHQLLPLPISFVARLLFNCCFSMWYTRVFYWVYQSKSHKWL